MRFASLTTSYDSRVNGKTWMPVFTGMTDLRLASIEINVAFEPDRFTLVPAKSIAAGRNS